MIAGVQPAARVVRWQQSVLLELFPARTNVRYGGKQTLAVARANVLQAGPLHRPSPKFRQPEYDDHDRRVAANQTQDQPRQPGDIVVRQPCWFPSRTMLTSRENATRATVAAMPRQPR